MSDMQDFSANPAGENPNQESGFEPMAVLPASSEVKTEIKTQNLKEIEDSLDGQSYFLGEVPQNHQFDPQAFLPLNSDRLIGSSNMIEKLLSENGLLIQEEVNEIQKLQRKINVWEDRIEKNKALIQKNLNVIKQNNTDIIYDKKNRDYWWGRSEQVDLDLQNAISANRQTDWAWIIKKYCLKNPDGTELDSKNLCVEELVNGEAANLSGEFKGAGNKYETQRKDRETDNNRMIRENSTHLKTNELLQGYIAATYANEIEPIQDGILLLKEFVVKLKSLEQDANATYGQMRDWAESFLNDFIKSNPRVAQSVVTDFRKLASISLPPHHC